MEDDLRSQEALIANVNSKGLIVHRILAFVFPYALGRVTVVFIELLGNVRADVAESLCRVKVTVTPLTTQISIKNQSNSLTNTNTSKKQQYINSYLPDNLSNTLNNTKNQQ